MRTGGLETGTRPSARRRWIAAASFAACAAAAVAGDETSRKPSAIEFLPVPPGAAGSFGGPTRGHAGALRDVAFVDANSFVSAGTDGTVHLWDARTGEHRAVLAVDRAFDRAAFSPNGTRLAYSNRRAVRLVDVDAVARPWKPRCDVRGAASSPVTYLVTSTGGDRALWVAAGRDGRLVAPNEFSPNGLAMQDTITSGRCDFAVVGNLDTICAGQNYVWFAQSKSFRRMFAAHETAVTALWLGHGDKWIATGAADGEVAMWYAADRGSTSMPMPPVRQTWRASGPSGKSVSFFVMAKDDAVLAAAGGARLRLFDVAKGVLRQTLEFDHDVVAVALSPDHKRLVCAESDGRMSLWDVKFDLSAVTGPRAVRTEAGALRGIDAFPPPGPTAFAVLDEAGVLRAYSRDGRELASLPPAGGWAALTLSPDGTTVVRRAEGMGLRAEAVATGQVAWSVEFAALARAQYSADGTRVAVLGADGALHVFAADTGRELFHGSAGSTLWWGGPALFRSETRPGPLRFLAADGSERSPVQVGASPFCAAATRDGRWIVVWTRAAGLCLYENGKRVMSLALSDERDPKDTSPVCAAAFSDDGDLVAVGTARGEIVSWDLADAMKRTVFAGHHGPVGGVAFVPGSQRLVSCGADGMWTIWDPKLVPVK